MQAQEAQLLNPSGTIKMEWRHLEHLPHAYLFIPVYLEGDNEPYYMQFDMGANQTLFYRGAPVSTSFRLGNSQAKLDSLRYANASYHPEARIIGTLGMDLLETASITLNFKAGEILFNEDLENKVSENFHYVMQKILLPAKFDGETKMLVYDSGSSAFDLITDPITWESLRDQSAEAKVIPSQSWGRQLKVHLAPTSIEISMAGEPVEIKQVAYVEGMPEENIGHMRSTGMQGMIGNTLFLRKVLYLDFRSMKFGLSKA